MSQKPLPRVSERVISIPERVVDSIGKVLFPQRRPVAARPGGDPANRGYLPPSEDSSGQTGTTPVRHRVLPGSGRSITSLPRADPSSQVTLKQDEPSEIEGLKRLMIAHQDRLQIRREQQATMGINTPPEILIEIRDIEKELGRLQDNFKVTKARQQLAEVTIDADAKNFSPEKLEETRSVIAVLLKIPPNRINISFLRDGSVTLLVQMAKEDYDKLEALYQEGDSTVEQLIQQLKPIENLAKANLRGLKLQGFDLFNGDLTNANLSSADLSKADLRRVSLRGANLRETDLRGANLTGANLRGADLRGADLRDTDLRMVNLLGIKYDQQTKWPW
jgi:hypothetical protein